MLPAADGEHQRGYCKGWGVGNLVLDGAASGGGFGGLAGIGLACGLGAKRVFSPNLTIRGCQIAGLLSETVAPFGAVTETDSFANSYPNLAIGVGWTNAARKESVLTGTPHHPIPAYNVFEKTSIAMPTSLGAGQTAYGVYLQGEIS